ncbi:uncharacterized protein LOC126880346 [Diabrotica virgifera virgifera]|uniref:Uncharacterized protein n=1 Tax=Diabrotica virgifera virgifera TaxID=50390 RepID=A0ABM5JQ90_DIAVI|nr:uncharacterized protein LOC126880346 [Diabrotica virgifera virgifera]
MNPTMKRKRINLNKDGRSRRILGLLKTTQPTSTTENRTGIRPPDKPDTTEVKPLKQYASINDTNMTEKIDNLDQLSNVPIGKSIVGESDTDITKKIDNMDQSSNVPIGESCFGESVTDIPEKIANVDQSSNVPIGEGIVGKNDTDITEKIANVDQSSNVPILESIVGESDTDMTENPKIFTQLMKVPIEQSKCTLLCRSSIENEKNDGSSVTGTARELMIEVDPNNPTKICIKKKPDYNMLSPINSDESDADLSDFDPTYKVENDIPKRKKRNLLLKNPKKIHRDPLVTQEVPH